MYIKNYAREDQMEERGIFTIYVALEMYLECYITNIAW